MAEMIPSLAQRTAAHPLTPPAREEIDGAGQLLKDQLPGGIVFGSIGLVEPDKALVKRWSADDAPLPRELRVLGYDIAAKKSFDARIDARAQEITSLTHLDEGHVPINFADVVRAVTIIKADVGYQAAMRERGIEDLTHVQIDPWPSGGFVHPEVPDGHRVLRGISFVREDKFDNGYARPVQGLIAHVDLTAGKVAYLEDHGAVPLPPEHGRYDAASQPSLRDDLKPISITQPQGTSFEVDGHHVCWQKWDFRVSMHPAHGLVLHQLGYEDQGRLRPILYRASLADMVVPYGDPDPMHSWKHVFDASEASIGAIPNSLTLGCDCLGEIHYFDVDVLNHEGRARTIENAICMHEEDFGIGWKHYDAQTQSQVVRRQRRLVISAIHTVGNYEYGFFWYLYLDGTIQMEVKLTGIVGVSAVAGDTDPEFAPLIAPNLASPVHQHLFNFRLDFDLDDTPMSVFEVNTEALPADHPDNPNGTGFRARRTLLDTEAAAQREVNAASSRNWVVVSSRSRNRLGNPVAFKLLPQGTPTLLASDDSPVGRRAGFARHNLWVTPFEATELSAAGDHTNLHPGGDGLPKWTAQNRSVRDTDVVLWHTVGLTHVPRPEDWPVMPVEYCGFTLLPVGFFERNPALDVPK
ncbi:MAG: primary-amine oxidase [Pseudomonadota bacterium]